MDICSLDMSVPGTVTPCLADGSIPKIERKSGVGSEIDFNHRALGSRDTDHDFAALLVFIEHIVAVIGHTREQTGATRPASPAFARTGHQHPSVPKNIQNGATARHIQHQPGPPELDLERYVRMVCRNRAGAEILKVNRPVGSTTRQFFHGVHQTARTTAVNMAIGGTC